MRFLDDHGSQKISLWNVLIPLKSNLVDFMLRTFINFVDQQNLFWLVFVRGLDLRVGIAFFLEIVEKVLLTFLYQIAIDGPFGIDGDQFLNPGFGQKSER